MWCMVGLSGNIWIVYGIGLIRSLLLRCIRLSHVIGVTNDVKGSWSSFNC